MNVIDDHVSVISIFRNPFSRSSSSAPKKTVLHRAVSDVGYQFIFFLTDTPLAIHDITLMWVS